MGERWESLFESLKDDVVREAILLNMKIGEESMKTYQTI